MILDTVFLIDILRGKKIEAKAKASELDEKFSIKGISSISVMELWKGAVLSVKIDKEKKKVNELLDSLIIYPFGEIEAKKSGEIEANLVKKGKFIDVEDIMIASTALIRNEKILTKNVRHFEDIDGLDIESY